MALVGSDSRLRISIITVCFNSSDTIENTIKSVVNQKDVNVEHIIIDGLSTDGTVDIIKKFKGISKFVSEKDKGIYDAMNKGLALATGDIVGTLNADDFYAHEDVLKKVERVFTDPNTEACYGDLVYVSQQDTGIVVRYWKSMDYVPGLFKKGWMPAHPTFFARKTIYDRFGGFELNYKIAADFELLFRFIEQNKIKTQYLPEVLVKMRLGGTTNKNLSNILKQNKEIITILDKYYVDFSVVKFVFSKLLNRFFQYIFHP